MSRSLFVILGLLFIAILPVASLLLFSSHTTIAVNQAPKVIGVATPVDVTLTNPHGVRNFTATIIQDSKAYPVHTQDEPATRFLFWRGEHPPKKVRFEAGRNKAPTLHDGKAALRLTATANDLRAAEDAIDIPVEVVSKPPTVVADGFQHYINQGGSELVVFTPQGYFTESGAKAGDMRFRSWPLPNSKTGERFSLFAFPWNLPANTTVNVYASNSAGSEATATFWQKITAKSFRKRDLPLSDAFLQKVTAEIDPGGSGDLVERFLKINRDLRQANNKQLAELRFDTEEKMLWSGPFIQLGNSKVEAQFADVRSYIYNGKKVDEQVHLGFDLSVVRNVPVAAANDGRVVLAERLGIYGNCIVIDHGYSLQSIYGHLSRIGVKKGDRVKRGQEIGRSGDTGLAGGDHLHFSMQVDGVQINPVEWWDKHWIDDRILSKLSPTER